MHIQRGNFGLYAVKFAFDLFYQCDRSGHAAGFAQRFQLLSNIRHMQRTDTATCASDGVSCLAQKPGIALIQRVSQNADALGALVQE